MKQPCADVVVVGGGHAGVEAARAAAALGAETLLVTHRLDRIGELSCNPAIGGIGKGHLVREIDALGGLIGRVGDRAGIHFRLLNRSKGPAVQAPRAQIDRALYREAMQTALSGLTRLTLVEGGVDDVLFDGARATGVRLEDGRLLRARAVVLTTGTFLRGVIHMGWETRSGGRIGDPAASALARRLEAMRLPLGRLKTGTPPRLAAESIAFDRLTPQPGDDDPEFLSFSTAAPEAPQLSCAVTRTTPETHAIIRAHLAESAMYSGRLDSRGPRYCPSIEDKVVRFAERESHQVFLEPEGVDSALVYPNGVSTSLDPETQRRFIRTMPGLEAAEIVQPGYAIEYDYVDPRALDPTLALKGYAGFFLAGQINGTTGYEEAAGQGLVAGLNAGLRALRRPPFHVSRTTSYLGVMIDDLVTRGVTEPYRMFTSRAEFRLSLRADNADQRLTPEGITLGIISPDEEARFNTKAAALDQARRRLAALSLSPPEAARCGFTLKQDGARRDGLALLALADDALDRLAACDPALRAIPGEIAQQLHRESCYSGYVARQAADIARLQRDEARIIPHDFCYRGVSGLSNELVERLERMQPRSLGQAARLEGMTPEALLLIQARLLAEDRTARAAS